MQIEYLEMSNYSGTANTPRMLRSESTLQKGVLLIPSTPIRPIIRECQDQISSGKWQYSENAKIRE
ncbi:MAG: hypothetical protein ACE5J9_07230 [Methanosarcinales archaeon]